MIDALNSFFPGSNQWIGLAAIILTITMFAGLGRMRGIASDMPGVSILIGWSVFVSVMTLAGVFTLASFSTVFWVLAAISLVTLIFTARHRILGIRPLVPYFVLGAPLLLIVAAKFPSEVDSFTHWLPNGLYILEHDAFLGPNGPPTKSAYPGFPYNVTFLFLAASKFAGNFVENAVILCNVVWLILFAAVIAWLLRRSKAVPSGHDWKLAAFSMFCATLPNPVFVRRIWLTSYPDTATSVTVLFAGLAGWLWIEAIVKHDRSELAKAATFAVLLALLVNIKQANLVLVITLVVSTGMVALRDHDASFPLYTKRLLLVMGTPLLLYFCWRYYLFEVVPLEENKIQPFADWPLDRLSDLLSKIGVVVYRKPLYFALAFGFVAWGMRTLISRPKSDFDRLTIIVGANFVGYNLFLLLIFIAHFGGHPQSYWRFNTHLGYLIIAATIFGFGVAYKTYRERLSERMPNIFKRISMMLIIILPALHLGLVNYWRFDLEIPKPMLREIGQDLARILPASANVAAIIPNDQGNFTSILRHYASQKRPDIIISSIKNTSQLDKFLRPPAEKSTFVWAYCPRNWLARKLAIDVPHSHAALFVRTADSWKVKRLWQLKTPGRFTRVYKLFNLSKCVNDY